MEAASVADLSARFDVDYDEHLVDRRVELGRRLADADALIVRNRTQVDARLLECAPRLRVVGRLGVGLDNIDLRACGERKIAVIPASGANAQAVAEYVIATSFVLLRGVFAASDDVAAGRWPRTALSSGRELAGRTIGLVGFGDIGRLTGALARALGMRTIGYDPQYSATSAVWSDDDTRPCALDELLGAADIVSLHVPLTPATRGLIDEKRLAAMKADAVLINTSRGGVVDEVALAAALRAGTIGGAALDVFEREPLPGGSPLVSCPHLVLTPHVAGVTRESNRRVSRTIAAKVAAALAA